PPDPASYPRPPSPVLLISGNAQISRPPLLTADLFSAPEDRAAPQIRWYRSPTYPPTPLPLRASIPLPLRPVQSAHDEIACQMRAASATITPTWLRRFPPPSATSAAAGWFSPAAHIRPAPDADGSEFPASPEHLLPRERDSDGACPEIRWKTHPPTAASLPRSSAAARDASACPTMPPPEPAPQSR